MYCNSNQKYMLEVHVYAQAHISEYVHKVPVYMPHAQVINILPVLGCCAQEVPLFHCYLSFTV